MLGLQFACVPFEALSRAELYGMMALRQEVFVVEQDCPYLDADGKDDKAWHVLGYDKNGDLVCYARLLPSGISYPGHASIGRVLTAQKVRGKGAGIRLMQECIRLCRLLFGDAPVKISAQTYLLRFYSDLGFVSTGKEYLEDGIPHTEMVMEKK